MKLQTLRPKVNTIPGRLQMATAVQAQRIRGRALQSIRDRILTRDQGLCRCLQCRTIGALALAHEVEHLVPLWAGGTETDVNRYAINRTCHAAKTACEAAMRARGAYDPSTCTCGRHQA